MGLSKNNLEFQNRPRRRPRPRSSARNVASRPCKAEDDNDDEDNRTHSLAIKNGTANLFLRSP